ncbi:VOC family protein [Eoetvoesiella caeni]
MKPPFSIKGLHHYAFRCRDAEETRHFYEDLLGLPLVHVIKADHVPSTGEYCPYVHIFFEMADGSCIAFFDLGDNQKALPSPNTPSWVNHIAMQVDTVEEIEAAIRRLREAGYEVLGVTDHEFVKSMYVFDPNGLRFELTTHTGSPAYMEDARANAHHLCQEWTKSKRQLESK